MLMAHRQTKEFNAAEKASVSSIFRKSLRSKRRRGRLHGVCSLSCQLGPQREKGVSQRLARSPFVAPSR
jgi:hypothetical protein